MIQLKLLLLAIVFSYMEAQYYPSLDLHDGCAYFNGESIGCYHFAIDDCNQSYIYIIAGPMFNSSYSGNIIDVSKKSSSIFGYTTTYLVTQNGYQVALTLNGGVYQDYILTFNVDARITNPYGDSRALNNIGIIESETVPCGTAGANTLPCNQYYHYPSRGEASNVRTVFARTPAEDYDSVIHVSSCLSLYQAGALVGTLVCPTVVADTCANTFTFTSYEGVIINLTQNLTVGSYSNKGCSLVKEDTNLCVAIHGMVEYPSFFPVAVNATVVYTLESTDDANEVLFNSGPVLVNSTFLFRQCGDSVCQSPSRTPSPTPITPSPTSTPTRRPFSPSFFSSSSSSSSSGLPTVAVVFISLASIGLFFICVVFMAGLIVLLWCGLKKSQDHPNIAATYEMMTNNDSTLISNELPLA